MKKLLAVLLLSSPAFADEAKYTVPVILPGGEIGTTTIIDPHPERGGEVIVCALANPLLLNCVLRTKDGRYGYVKVPTPQGSV